VEFAGRDRGNSALRNFFARIEVLQIDLFVFRILLADLSTSATVASEHDECCFHLAKLSFDVGRRDIVIRCKDSGDAQNVLLDVEPFVLLLSRTQHDGSGRNQNRTDQA
jgi:hypothetical protein